MRVIVCGGRNYRDRAAVFAALDRLHAERVIDIVMQGAAKGADELAHEWAAERDIPCVSYKAEWDLYGNRAGPLRNQKMLDIGMPDGVVAFPGWRGTADMVERAEVAGLKVWFPCGRPA